MAGKCSICARDDRSALDRRLAAGTPTRALAAECGASPDALRRHKAHHLPVRLLQRQALAEARATLDVAKILGLATASAVAVLETAQDGGRPDLILRAVDRLLACCALQARIAELVDADELRERLIRLEDQLTGIAPRPGARPYGGRTPWPN